MTVPVPPLISPRDVAATVDQARAQIDGLIEAAIDDISAAANIAADDWTFRRTADELLDDLVRLAVLADRRMLDDLAEVLDP